MSELRYQRCGKIQFVTRADAKKFMKRENSRRNEILFRAVYFCDSCKAFHLTSMEKKRSRAITRHQRKYGKRNNKD